MLTPAVTAAVVISNIFESALSTADADETITAISVIQYKLVSSSGVGLSVKA